MWTELYKLMVDLSSLQWTLLAAGLVLYIVILIAAIRRFVNA